MTKRNVTIIIKGDNYDFNADISHDVAIKLINSLMLDKDLEQNILKSKKTKKSKEIKAEGFDYSLLKNNFEKIAVVIAMLFDKLNRPISVKEIQTELQMNSQNPSNIYRDLKYAHEKNLIIKPDKSRHNYLPTEKTRALYETVR